MGMSYKQSKGDNLYRRSLYTIWKRTVAPPTLAVFDSADREACWVNRKETNTPLQALTLLNETGYVEAARHLAERILREGGDAPLEFAFRLVLSRDPTPDELSVLTKAIDSYRADFKARPEAAKEMLTAGASPPSSGFPASELAAWTTLANVLLNLDETITRK